MSPWDAAEAEGRAGRLLGAVFDAFRPVPFERIRPESAESMQPASGLCEAWGFVRRPPFRPPSPSSARLAVSMERTLPLDAGRA